MMKSVSVVIPTYNGKKLLEKHLPKIIAAVGQLEIIVVDDASTDKSLEFLQKNYSQIKIVKHSKNRRFAAACNSGVKNARGEVIVLLNNDVAPKKNFLKPLTRHFEDQETFSVGCRELDIKQGKKEISGRTAGRFKRGFLVHWRPKDQESKETFWTFGGSMAVDKRKYLEIGGMDEIYSPAYWEDIDLCWRAKKKGWKIVFEKNAVVYHHHESTNKPVLGKTRIKLYAHRNQILFVWKNIRGRQLVEHFLWLPYHLLVTTFRTKGVFLLAYFAAIYRWFTYRQT